MSATWRVLSAGAFPSGAGLGTPPDPAARPPRPARAGLGAPGPRGCTRGSRRVAAAAVWSQTESAHGLGALGPQTPAPAAPRAPPPVSVVGGCKW